MPGMKKPKDPTERALELQLKLAQEKRASLRKNKRQKNPSAFSTQLAKKAAKKQPVNEKLFIRISARRQEMDEIFKDTILSVATEKDKTGLYKGTTKAFFVDLPGNLHM